MTYAPFLIANFKTGLDREVEPWLLPADAFSEVRNAYLKRGVWNKRNGYNIFKTFAAAKGVITAITQANPAVVTVVNHGFSTGDVIFITGVVGMTQINNLNYTITVLTPDTFSLDGIDSTLFTAYVSGGIAWFYPGTPIMGLENFIKPDGSKQLCIFNTRRMAIYDPASALPNVFAIGGTYTGGATNRFADYFTGNDSNFFWTENYRSTNTITDNKLYITNNVDNIHTWDGTTIVPFIPQYGATGADIVQKCFFIFAFKQRLVLLSTQEAGSLRPQRARWSQAQNPTIWRDDIPGQGGFLDAPTGEFILGAAFLKDLIIVQFTNSWWMLRPTSDPALPFRWDKITSNRAVNAPYATLSYDKSVTGIGQSGIIECNGVEVARIDDKIPDFVSDVNQLNFHKMFARRYLEQQQTWTLYPSENNTTSDEILVLNEQEGSWSQYDLPLSCLGVVDNVQDPKWEDYQAFPGDPSATLPPYVWVAAEDSGDEDFGEEQWLSGYLQPGSLNFIGGGHDGVIYTLNQGTDDNGQPIAMEMLTARWNPFKDKGIQAQIGYVDFLIDSDPVSEVEIEFFVNNDSSPYKTQTLNFIPQNLVMANIGGISQSNPAVVNAYSHNLNTSDVVNFYRIEGMEILNGGTFTITAIDSNNFSIDNVDSTLFDPYAGDGIVVQGSFQGLKVWKRVFAGAVGFAHRMRLTNNQAEQPIRIHAIMPWFRPVGSRMIGI